MYALFLERRRNHEAQTPIATNQSCRISATVLVFFFQAEDGIRYLTVTGVQTCALPISSELKEMAVWLKQCAIRTIALQSTGVYLDRGLRHSRRSWFRSVSGECPGEIGKRRVGKEGRSRWSPYH